MSEYTEEHRAKLREYLDTHELSEGLGNKESACALAAINFAINGKITDEAPECMSPVLRRATIALQDAMPAEMRNSKEFKDLICDMPGTGRELEEERLKILMDWMWETVLPQVQPTADKYGFGEEWRTMCREKTSGAAARAARATDATRAAALATRAALAALAAADADAADAALATRAARAADAARAALATRAAADAADAGLKFWQEVKPVEILKRMTFLDNERREAG